MADRAAADAAVAQAAGLTEGVLHILVNNAGVTAPAMFADLTDESFRRLLDVHLMGAFHCSQAALPFLPTDGTGRIINVTSSAGITGTLGQVNYSAAKAGIIGFTKSLARELARKNILVNALAPLAATPMTETIRTNEKFAANMMARIPLQSVGRTGGDRRGIRLPRLRRRFLHHRPGAAGGRWHGDVMPSVTGTRRWRASPWWPWSRPCRRRCARARSATSVRASSRWRTRRAGTSRGTTTMSSTALRRISFGSTAARSR